MLWPAIVLIVLAVAAAIIGFRITNGPGSGDERAGGAIFWLAAAALAGLGILWWIVAVTIKAFG